MFKATLEPVNDDSTIFVRTGSYSDHDDISLAIRRDDTLSPAFLTPTEARTLAASLSEAANQVEMSQHGR